jgi:single-strand DNA-binding protein
MRTYQLTVIIGRLGQEPELRYTAEGQAVAKFSLATDRRVKPGSDPVTDWHAIVCFQQQAEFAAKYLTKGRLLLLQGDIRYSTWEDKEGKKHRATEIVASHLMPLDRRPEPDLHVVEAGNDPDDLPF